MVIEYINFHIKKNGKSVEVLLVDKDVHNTWFAPDPATLAALYSIANNQDPKPHIFDTPNAISLSYSMEGY